jgi:zinc protease
VAGHEARQLLSSLIGGLFTSRLNTNLREQHGYTYGAFSRAVATRRWGAFLATTAVQTEVTAPALQQLRTELGMAHDARLGRPITPDEVQRARADLVNSLGSRLQSVQSVSAVLTTQFIHGLSPDYHAGYPRRLAAITPAAVTEQARSHLLPERLLVVLVGDRSRLEPALSAAGIPSEPAAPELLE